MEARQIKEGEHEKVSKALNERLEAHDESRKAAQEKLHNFCEELREQIDELEERVNSELEEKFTKDDSKLQSAYEGLQTDDNVSGAVQKAEAGLLVEQTYDLVERKNGEKESDQKMRISSLYELKTERKVVSLKLIEFEGRKPANLVPSFTEKGELSLSFAFFSEDEVEALKGVDSPFEVEVKVKVWEKGQEEEDTSKTLGKKMILGCDESVCFRNTFTANTLYCLKMRIVRQGMSTQWSDEAEFTTPEFKDLCVWKECPDDADGNVKYSVDEKNPRIATKISYGNDYCTIIANTALPLSKVTSWSIKVLKSRNNNGGGIWIGVAPFDINQNEIRNFNKCGWYLYCYDSTLNSGLPHRYRRKEYGPRKEWEENGQYVHTGDSVGVVMDATKGELSFALNGVNLGIAYEGIPLDKPLVPCVLLKEQGDSVELDTSEVKENVDSSINISNITPKSTIWDSITLMWDSVEGASFYQIEVDESRFWDGSTRNAFTKRRLLSDTEHTFRVRAVRGNSVSEWSNAVKGRTQKASSNFSECSWKECPDNVDDTRKYSVDEENPIIANNTGGNWCTVIGNTPLPLNKVISWSIKVLKSKYNNGSYIYIGVAPSNINQNEGNNYNKCGWYLYCYDSTLNSGLPHNYSYKEYGPRKGWGQYVRTGDSVGVVMDTVNGELSFVLNGVNLGVAYEGIPLDKPLVPCVLLDHKDDSVEFDTSEVKETAVNGSIPVPSNIITKYGITWDSINLTWDAVEGASFYQIEVDESKSWDGSTTNTFTKSGLLPETEYSFRVRAVRGNAVSEWSDVVKEMTYPVPSKRKVKNGPRKQTQQPVPVPVPQIQERLSEEEKQNIGERIFNVAMTSYGNEDLSGRLTGMILDSVQVSVLHALMANEENLKAKIGEAKAFLDDYVREHPEQQ